MSEQLTVLAGRVLTMEDGTCLDDQAITLHDGRIAALGHRNETALMGRVVDWRDRTVMPGLADMHAHVDERADMLVNLAHGVTLLRNMWGTPWHLRWRDRVAVGLERGPYLVTTSPIVDGRGLSGTTFWPGSACVETAEEARAAVRRWVELGYSQVKAYNWLSHEALQGLGDACAEAGIILAGHCPASMTVQEAMEHGQTCFEHLTNYEYGALTDDGRTRLDGLLASGVSRWHPDVAEARTAMDPSRLADLAAEVAGRGVASAATLIVLDRMFGPKDFDDPRLALVSPTMVDVWRPENHVILAGMSPEERKRAGAAAQERTRRVVSALRDAGAKVLVGTDAPNPFVFQGSSVVEEMQLLVEAGYGIPEVLQMATRGAADFLGLDDRGRLTVGSAADLIAVNGDPRNSLVPLRQPSGVIVAGEVLERADLDRLLAEARSLLSAPPEELPDLGDAEGEELVGTYIRSNFDRVAGMTAVSCCAKGGGLARWTERTAERHRSETKRTVIDSTGLLVEAHVFRRHVDGEERVDVERGVDGSSYRVSITHLDGAITDATVEGPVIPSHDLGAHAFLASMARIGDEEVRALTLRESLLNGLPPRPATVLRSGGSFVVKDRSADVNVSADESFNELHVRDATEFLSLDRQDEAG